MSKLLLKLKKKIAVALGLNSGRATTIAPTRISADWCRKTQEELLHQIYIPRSDRQLLDNPEYREAITELSGAPDRFQAPSKHLTKNQIQARLIERGTNFRQWALAHGYLPRTVTQVVERWAGRDELPRGRLSFRILRELSNEIGAEIVPGLWEEAA